MMDMSSIVDAGLTFAGVIAVVLMGVSTWSSESATVSTTSERTASQPERHEYPYLRNAA